MKIVTPEQIEAHWLRIEKKTVTWFAQSGLSLWMGIALAMALSFSCYKFAYIWSLFFRPAGHLDVYRLTSTFFPFLILFALIPLVVGRLPWIVTAGITALIWVVGLLSRHFEFADSKFLFASMPLLMFFATALWFARRQGMNKFVTLTLWLLVFLGVSYGLGVWVSGSPTAGSSTKVFWRLLPQYYFFLVFAHVLSEDASKKSEHLLLTPAHLVFPLVFPVGTEPLASGEGSASREFWWEGFLRLARGLVTAIPLIFADDMLIRSGWLAWPDILWRHLFLLLATITVGNVGVGLAQMFGIKAPPGTLFVFLARSPIDFWKRDSTYAYHFALRFIFFPAARFFKHAAPAMAFSFAVFYLYRQTIVEHGVIGFYAFFFPANNFQVLATSFPGDYWMWLGWFAIIALSAKFWFSPQFARRSSFHAWVPVLATHVAMMLPQLVFHLY